MYRLAMLISALICPVYTFFPSCNTLKADGCSIPVGSSCKENGCSTIFCIPSPSTTNCLYRNPAICNTSPRTICSSTSGLTQCQDIHQCKWCPKLGTSSCIDACDITTNAIDALPGNNSQAACTAINGKYCPLTPPGFPKCQYRHRDCLVSWREDAAPAGINISDIQSCEMMHGGKWCPRPGMPTCIKPQPTLITCFGTHVRLPAYGNKIDCHNNEGVWCDHSTHKFCIQLPDPNCANCSCAMRRACGPSSTTYDQCLNEGCVWCNTGIGPKCIFGSTDVCLNTRLCFSPYEQGITRGYCNAPGNKCKWCPTNGNEKYNGLCVENCPPGHRLRYAHTDQCCKETIAITSRITGGKPATRGRWPWQGYLIVRLPTNSTTQCGAVLISPSLALTAAHCVAGISSILFVYFGLQTTTNIDPQSMVRFGPSFVIHPGYNPSTFANDIAVINLTPLIVFNDVVQPVALPQSEIVPIGTKCIATGFGLAIPGGFTSTRLLEVTKFIQPNEICNRYGIYNQLIQICAGTLSGQEGGTTCQGDSGGPLVCQRCSSCEWYVAGLTSFGPRNCNDPNIAAGFARVSYYEPWIRSQGYVPPNNITHSCP